MRWAIWFVRLMWRLFGVWCAQDSVVSKKLKSRQIFRLNFSDDFFTFLEAIVDGANFRSPPERPWASIRAFWTLSSISFLIILPYVKFYRKGSENKEWPFFLTPKCFFSDWRVGWIRPPGEIFQKCSWLRKSLKFRQGAFFNLLFNLRKNIWGSEKRVIPYFQLQYLCACFFFLQGAGYKTWHKITVRSYSQQNLEKDLLQSMSFQKFKWGLIDNRIWKKTFCKFQPSEKSKSYNQPLRTPQKREVL